MGNKSKSIDRRKISRRHNIGGFTLMEIIVVIAVLGALAALAIPRFTGVLENSQKNTDQANIRIVESAVELYKAEVGNIPAGVNTFNELIEELSNKGYLKNTEVKAVTKGRIFTYDAGTKQISLVASP